MLSRTRKAFTMLELIVVIVILGILALLAIPTFQGVIDRSRASNVKAAADSTARNIKALAAFESADVNLTEYVSEAVTEINDAGDEVTATADTAVGGAHSVVTLADDEGNTFYICLDATSAEVSETTCV